MVATCPCSRRHGENKAKPMADQKSVILATFGKHSKPKGSILCDRAAVAKDISTGDMKALPMGDEKGIIHRDDLLTWLFEDPSRSQELFGKALKVRTCELLSEAEKSSRGATLTEVWQNGQAPPAPTGISESEDALWQQCLIDLGASTPPVTRAANHFSKVIEVGFDANKVPFPHKALRQGYPMPLPPLTPMSDLTVCDGNSLPFPFPGPIHDNNGVGSGIVWKEGVEEEVGQIWLAGLAHNSCELRSIMHVNLATFDMVLAPWPMTPSNVLNADKSNDLQHTNRKTVMRQEFQHEEEQIMVDPLIFDEHRYLRGKMHANTRRLSVQMDAWATMPDNVIKKDVCGVAQLEVHQCRALRGPLSKEQLEKRRADLQKKLAGLAPGAPVTNPRFFEEVYPVLEKETAIAQANARNAMDNLRRAREHDEAAELGAKFVVWPVFGSHRWPQPCAAWTEHSQWFAKWRGMRRARQATARKWAQLCKMSQKKHDKSEAAAKKWAQLCKLSQKHDKAEAAAKKWAQLCKMSQKKQDKLVSESPWLRIVRKLSGSTSSTSSCHSSERCQGSDSDWEALSNCSDSSWEVGSEWNDESEYNNISLWDLVPEASQVEEIVDRIGKLNLALGVDGKLSIA